MPDSPPFRNQPLTDFSKTESLSQMEAALRKVRQQLGKEYALLFGGEKIHCEEKFSSLNPSRKQEVVGIFQKSTRELADRAIGAAEAAFADWSRTPARERADALLRVSGLLQERRLELASWMVIEVGKSWVEADADVAEAIDFSEYYAREMLRLAGPQSLVQIDSEESELQYIPLGVGVVIPPWNFPLAILAGMTFATVVAGNTVVVKPSSDSPTIAAKLIEIFERAGFPKGVVNFLTGSGAQIGDHIIGHRKTRFVAFTGSKQVGLRINKLAARPQAGQIWIKRVIAEMGGKNAIVIDSDADLEEAATGVVFAAFGYQGQKCSACSRAIVVRDVYEPFLDLLREKTLSLIREGNVEQADINFGPVINERAQRSILDYIRIGKQEGRLLLGGDAGSPEGFFIRPTILADIEARDRIAQEEIFGPVLAVIRAQDYDSALQIANDSEYGLTGSVYSRDRAKLEKAKREFHVGNLYLNRKCTGALVGVHPFGGFNMSGTNSKAGGPDYLLLFTQAKAISRNRRTPI